MKEQRENHADSAPSPKLITDLEPLAGPGVPISRPKVVYQTLVLLINASHWSGFKKISIVLEAIRTGEKNTALLSIFV